MLSQLPLCSWPVNVFTGGLGGGVSLSGCEKLFGIFSTEERLGNDTLDHQQLRHHFTHSAM